MAETQEVRENLRGIFSATREKVLRETVDRRRYSHRTRGLEVAVKASHDAVGADPGRRQLHDLILRRLQSRRFHVEDHHPAPGQMVEQRSKGIVTLQSHRVDEIDQPQADVLGNAADGLDGGFADSFGRTLQQTQKAVAIAGIEQKTDMGHGVLHLGPPKEAKVVDDEVIDLLLDHHPRDLDAQDVGPGQDRDARRLDPVLGHQLPDTGGNPPGLVGNGVFTVYHHFLAHLLGHRLDGLGHGSLAGLDEGFTGLQDGPGATVIVYQGQLDDRGELAFEPAQDAEGDGAAPFIDGLVDVAEESQVVVKAGQAGYDLVLGLVGVLHLIDLDPAIQLLPAHEKVRILPEQPVDAGDQVRKVELVVFAQGLVVAGQQFHRIAAGQAAGDQVRFRTKRLEHLADGHGIAGHSLGQFDLLDKAEQLIGHLVGGFESDALAVAGIREQSPGHLPHRKW